MTDENRAVDGYEMFQGFDIPTGCDFLDKNRTTPHIGRCAVCLNNGNPPVEDRCVFTSCRKCVAHVSCGAVLVKYINFINRHVND